MEILFKAKEAESGKWVEGLPTYDSDGEITKIETPPCWPVDLGAIIDIDPKTMCRYTGLKDKEGNRIFEGDMAELFLPDGERRVFLVEYKNVTRDVKSHPDFDDPSAHVEIMGVVFSWGGFDLFPCVNGNISDCSKMKIIGNQFDRLEN